VVACRCLPAENDPVKRRLKVHYSRDTEHCWLSSYAFTGNEHKPDCRFYSVWSDERQAEIYQGEAVRAAADGTIVVRLPTGLQKKAPSEVKPPENVSDDEPVKRKRRPSMTLLGLLHLLWEQSGINVWHPAFGKNRIFRTRYQKFSRNRKRMCPILLLHMVFTGYRSCSAGRTVTGFFVALHDFWSRCGSGKCNICSKSDLMKPPFR